MASMLFAYGTLECPELMLALSGLRLRAAPALLDGYRRGMLVDRRYPGILPSGESSVRGTAYEGLDEQALRMIDCFEAHEYDRVEVVVQCEDGRRERAFAYVVCPQHRELVSDRPWDAVAFRQQHLDEYRELCTELRRKELAKRRSRSTR